MQASELSIPRKQAPLGVIIIFLMNVRKWLNVLVFGLIPFIRQTNDKLPFWMFWVFASVVLVIIMIWSYLQWQRYFFFIKDDKFIIKQGVLRKEETLIGLERIQSVQIKRNIVQQILNLASLQLDTAGSSKKEAQIPALNYAYAEELKQLLIHLKTKQNTVTVAEENVEPIIETEKVIMKLSVIDLFKVGITENHFRSALLLLGIFFGYTSQFSELIGYDEENVYKEAFQFVTVILPIFIIFFLVISVFLSMARMFLRYFDLTVALKKNGLSINSGLIKKEENFVPVNKIQYIKWKSNPLRRLIGYKSLSIYQASSQQVQKKKTAKVPGCTSTQILAIEETFFPEHKPENEWVSYKPNAFWKFRLMLLFVGLPIVLGGFFFFAGNYPFSALAAVIVLPAIFFVHQYVLKFVAEVSEDLIVINRGYVFPEQVLLKTFKVQNLVVKQSVFQKRRGLVSIKIYTASGGLTIPFISEIEGKRLANKLLYTVENSRKSWM